MKVMVFDVAAESGGALSVLNDFYKEFKTYSDINFIFVLSIPELKETENIKVLRFPWIKKSWLHRLYFDNIIAPRLVKDYKVDQVFSLQNLIIPHVNIYQTVYIHNSLPFVKYRFSIFQNKLLWFYQNIFSRLIYKSIKKANKVIVQTNWMKKACLDKLRVKDEKKVIVLPPKIHVVVKHPFSIKNMNEITFFYPASSIIFKNHKVIINACIRLKKENVNNYKIIFTLEGNENREILNLYHKVKGNNLPVEFIGNIPREKVFEYYSKSILVFPSYIESSPLPLTEAKIHGTPILVADCDFAHEILEGYRDVEYFDPFSEDDLAFKLIKIINQFKNNVNNITTKFYV